MNDSMPLKAKQKMQIAQKYKRTVYLYGATGYGKTEFVKQYLFSENYYYLSCKDPECDLSVLFWDDFVSKTGFTIVVIDDICQIYNRERQKDICKLVLRQDIWLILIGRSCMPSWLLSTYVNKQIQIISEEDLGLTKTEIEKLAGLYSLDLEEEEIDFLEKKSEGNAYAIRHYLFLRKEGEEGGDVLLKKMWEAFILNIEKNILEELEGELLEFLLQVSVVEEFNKPLAEFITGNYRVPLMLEKAKDAGNFLIEKEETFSIRLELREALQNYAQKTYGENRIREYLYRAGLYYETQGQLVEALELYERSGNNHRVLDILVRNAREHPGVGFYFELRDYYLRLSEEQVADKPILLAALSMLYSLLLQPKESEIWYEKLVDYEKITSRMQKKEAITWRTYLDIGLPHRGIKDLKEIFPRVAKMMMSRDFSLPEFCLTSNIPSVMNGGKDFCEWSRKDQQLADTIGIPVSLVLGKYGKGLVHEALGESFFEKGENTLEIFSRLSRAQLEAENGGKKELLFAVITLQAKVNLILGHITTAREQVKSFEKKLVEEDPKLLRKNVNAVYCRLNLYEGKSEKIAEWLLEAPDENEVFFVMDRYRYLTKVRCYIYCGEYLKGLSLLERIKYYGEQYDRPYIRMEAVVLEAIIRRRIGAEWKPLFLDVLEKISSYHFVRILSLQGAAMLPLLRDIKKEYKPAEKEKKEWWKQVLEETEKIATYYPRYLNSRKISVQDFSDNAIKILKMQAEGMTIKQIADQLCLAETTIKYHATETYRKLEARGKTDAVQKARKLGIIQ